MNVEAHPPPHWPRIFSGDPGRLRWIALILYVLFLNLWGLGRHGLFEPDEGRYANMALEFLEPEHDRLEPTLSDVSHFDKPPLIYWMTGTSLAVFGVNEFAARLPSVVGSFLGLAGVALLAFRLHGEKAAWWGVLVFATTLQCWALARLLSPDMLLCGLCTLGAGCCLGGVSGSRFGWWCAGAILWSLAWWDKATACLVPLFALTVALHLSGRQDLLARLRPFRLFLTILILGSPWYVLMMVRHGELDGFFFHRELAGRVLGHVDGRSGFPGFHFVTAAVLWLPWWPLAVRGVLTSPGFKQSLCWKERLRSIPFEFIVALLVLTVFSFISSKLITYTVTGAPWLTAGIGGCLKNKRFSPMGLEGRLLVLGAVFVVAVVMVLPRFEASLGVNSSTRKVVETSRRLGGKTWICDRFLPGMEFYAGESVYYVNTESLVQVRDSPGQMPDKHFKTDKEVASLVASSGEGVWLVQSRKKAPNWISTLLEATEGVPAEPVVVGDFKLWKLR